MKMKIESDYSIYRNLPIEINYDGEKINLGVGFEGDEEVNIIFTVEQAKELKCMLDKTLEEIE